LGIKRIQREPRNRSPDIQEALAISDKHRPSRIATQRLNPTYRFTPINFYAEKTSDRRLSLCAFEGLRQSGRYLERYYFGMVIDETELAPLEEHLIACLECVERAKESDAFVDSMRRALSRIVARFCLRTRTVPSDTL
jgi:hypothetical protein